MKLLGLRCPLCPSKIRLIPPALQLHDCAGCAFWKRALKCYSAAMNPVEAMTALFE
jgi:hypothetical protein